MDLLKHYIYISGKLSRDVATDIADVFLERSLASNNLPLPRALSPSGLIFDAPVWLDVDNAEMIQMTLESYQYRNTKSSFHLKPIGYLVEVAGVERPKILARSLR